MKYNVEYDVVVAGGGIAGVAAAVQAARSGKKTALIEKTVLPGGLATTGLVYIYLPICDGNGKQVTFGLAEELLNLSMTYGPGDVRPEWKEGKDAPEIGRYRCIFSPASYILALDEILEKNGVDIWFDTLICDAEVTENKVRAIICENKSGRGRVQAKCFVDATGDADVARHAGIPCHDEFNFLSVWALQYNSKHEKSDISPNVHMHFAGIPWDPEKAPEGTLFRGVNGRDVSSFILKGRKMLRDFYRNAYENGRDRHELYPLKVPAMPQFRKTYSIDGDYILDTDENNKHFDDSIGLLPDWRKAGPVWEIPYRTLYPKCRTGAFLAAGRCSAAMGDAWEVTRVIPSAAMTGQVAGLAAAMSIDEGVEPYELDIKKLQSALRKLGFPLHLEEVGLHTKN